MSILTLDNTCLHHRAKTKGTRLKRQLLTQRRRGEDPPDVFEAYRLPLVEEPFLLIDGMLQRQDGVVSVKARHLAPLEVAQLTAVSHDFH